MPLNPGARAVANAFGAQDVATDAAAVIARTDVDAIVIASPDATHAPLALACIIAGRPVLCEKPLSQSADCLHVTQAEMASGRCLIQPGRMRRCAQSDAAMKSALDDGSLGRALMMHKFHHNVATPATDFTADMAITNSAPHAFDVPRFVLGQDYSALSAFTPRGDGPLVGETGTVATTPVPHTRGDAALRASTGYDGNWRGSQR